MWIVDDPVAKDPLSPMAICRLKMLWAEKRALVPMNGKVLHTTGTGNK